MVTKPLGGSAKKTSSRLNFIVIGGELDQWADASDWDWPWEGGGARGLAHIGVLKVLENNRIPIDMITSIGAPVGAAYAANPDAGALKQKVLQVLGSDGDYAKGLKLLGRIQWNDGTNSDWLNRIYRFAQKEVFLSLTMFGHALLAVEDMRDAVETSSR
jgi:hypothetical protein